MPYDVKDFPSSEELERVAIEDRYFKLLNSDAFDYEGKTDTGAFRLKEFFSNDKKKAEILAKALNVAPLIVDVGTDFLFGEPFQVAIEAEGKEKTEKKITRIVDDNRLQERMEESSQLLQAIGHVHFKLFGKGNEAVVEEIPYSYWFPNWSGVPNGADPNNVRIVSYLTHQQPDGVAKKYVYIEDYFMEEKTAIIEYALYEDKGGKLGDPVALETLDLVPKGDNVQKVVEKSESGTETETQRYRQDTKLDELPLVTVNLRKTVMQRYGQSIFKRIMPLLEELNDRLSQISIQFLKHLNAKIQVPDGSVVRDPKTGKVQSSDVEVLIAKAGEPDARYITNENPLIEQAFKHMEMTLREIAKLTQTPDSFVLEDEKGGQAERAETLRTRMMNFLKRVRRYERKYDEAIKDILRIALKIEGEKDVDKLAMSVTFDQGIPKDWESDERVWGDALGRGLASRETAVGRFQGIEGDELEEELSRIQDEEEEAMKSRVQETLAAMGNEQ
jgi:hypothetical protein